MSETHPATGSETETAAGADGERAPLRTRTERIVAGVWSETLGCEVRSAADDFFDLGGHSLVATRVTGRLGRALGIRTALTTLFDHRTVGAVAAALDEQVAAGTGGPAVELVDSGEPAPLSVQQEAIWATEELLAGTPFNHVLLPIRVTGRLDLAALRAALGQVVAAHPALRTRFSAVDGNPVQQAGPGSGPLLPEIDLRRLEPGRRWKRAASEARALFREPFDLAAGDVVHAAAVRMTDEEWITLLCVHHIVCDGVSSRIILEDLAAAYRRRTGVSEPATADAGPALAYSEYARDQRAEPPEADIAYWVDKLSGPAGTGPGRPASFRFRTVRAQIDGELLAGIREFSRAAAATPFMALAASVTALTHLRTGDPVIRLATLAANRQRPEFERTVGFFATTLVLQSAVGGSHTFRELFDAVRRDALESVTHEAAPAELIVPRLAAEAGGDTAALCHLGLAWEPARPPQDAGPVVFSFHRSDDSRDLLPVVPSSTPLSLLALELDDRLTLRLEYDESLLDADAAERFLADLTELLRRQLDRPDAPLDDLAAFTQDGTTAVGR